MSAETLRAAALATLVLGSLGLGLAATEDATLERADFAFCNQDEVASLDPALATGFPEGRVVGALFEGLTRLDPVTLEPLPGVADAWEVSPDSLRWTFHLRPEARWSNGDPLTAEDVRYGLLRLLDPATHSSAGYLLGMLTGATEAAATPLGVPFGGDGVGIRAVGPHQLELQLDRPCPELPRLLAYPVLAPVHRPSLEAHGNDWIKPGLLVSNGAFRLAQRRLKDRIRLVRNEHYWGVDEVQLRTVDALAANGVTTQLNLFLTGEVDWMIKPPPGLYDELLPRAEARVGPQFGTTFLRFNVRREPYGDVRVRRALTLALDRDSLARDVMRGGRVAAVSFVPPGLPGYEPARLAPCDPDLARALLAEAGFPGGRDLPAVELLYPGNENTRDLCQAIAETWRRELGVRTRLIVQSWKVYLDSSRNGFYDAAWSSWIGDWLDPGTFLEVFLSSSESNRTGWADPEYDALVGLATREPDAGLRARAWARAEQHLLDVGPIAPIHQRVNINLVSGRVAGFQDNLLDLHPLRDLAVTAPPP